MRTVPPPTALRNCPPPRCADCTARPG